MTSMLEALKQLEARSPVIFPPTGSSTTEEASVAVDEACEAVEKLRERPAEPAATAPPSHEPAPIPPSAEVPAAEPVPLEPTAPDPPEAHAKQECEPGRELAKLLERPVPLRDRPYRDLAANLLSQLETTHPSVLLFVAPSGSGSRTSHVARLAGFLAGEVKGGVLLVDADLLTPSVAETFGVSGDRGLADVLLGVAAWQELVQRTTTEGLSVLPGRPFPAAKAPALTPVLLARLLDDLRRQFGLVLLDAGQAAPDEVAPWSRFCDGTYLVATLGETTARAAKQAAELIDQHAGRIGGTVLIEPAA